MLTITGQRIVVIGGNGTLGSAAVRGAISHGAKVTIFSRHARASGGAAEAVQGAITDPPAVRKAIKDAQGIVISVEASRTPEQLNAVYVEGVRNVLDGAPAGAHVIFMGHIGITNVDRMPDYNRAKLSAEQLIRESGVAYTIIRPSWVVSGDEGSRGVKLEQGDLYTGRRDDIAAGDLGAAIVAAFENEAARGKTFELYGGGARMPDWSVEFGQLKLDS